jgi:hypothetical protein
MDERQRGDRADTQSHMVSSAPSRLRPLGACPAVQRARLAFKVFRIVLCPEKVCTMPN